MKMGDCFSTVPIRAINWMDLQETKQYSRDNGGFARTREDLKQTFENLKRKVEGMEEEIFDKERDWDQRFHEDGR